MSRRIPLHSHAIESAEIDAAKEAVSTHRQIETALRERIRVLESSIADRGRAHAAEVSALRSEISRLRGRAADVEQQPTTALERIHAPS